MFNPETMRNPLTKGQEVTTLTNKAPRVDRELGAMLIGLLAIDAKGDDGPGSRGVDGC